MRVIAKLTIQSPFNQTSLEDGPKGVLIFNDEVLLAEELPLPNKMARCKLTISVMREAVTCA